jgi:hypothetical protein
MDSVTVSDRDKKIIIWNFIETFAMPVNIQYITLNYLPSSKVQLSENIL